MPQPSRASTFLLPLATIGFLLTAAAAGQQTPPPPADPSSKKAAPAQDTNEGIPIASEAVKQACGVCHKADDKQRMSRISYRRTTPEGWQETVRRMVTLHSAQLDVERAREVVRYLSNNHGLAPEEVAPAAFEVERRIVDYRYQADAETHRVCSSCHSIGRVLHQRRTKEEWDLLMAMHRGFYPLVDVQVFRRMGPPPREPGPDGRPPDPRHPMDKVVQHLQGAFPLTTPEWGAWSATMRPPKIEGEWTLSGHEPGRGPIFGRMTIAAGANPDEFVTRITYVYARGNGSVTRTGKVQVYTGFQWRGRSTVEGDEAAALREVMHVDRDWRTISGRWFSGGYDERGVDVRLVRIGREAVVTGVEPVAVKQGGRQRVRVFGANLPAAATPADLDFGPGITVARVVSAEPAVMDVEVDVAAGAAVGRRDLFAGGTMHRGALAVYDRVDYIKVTPNWNMARVGGAAFPKMFAQFEAVAYHHGPDGKPDTPDDVSLGVVPAKWTTEEYTATFEDDDRAFVGTLEPATGLFTPAEDGPNPKRSGNRNNIGDVWVVAAYTPSGGTPLRARAHLIVTVPLYMRWDAAPPGVR
jgi:quinohemoprotein amine dehydrogenase